MAVAPSSVGGPGKSLQQLPILPPRRPRKMAPVELRTLRKRRDDDADALRFLPLHAGTRWIIVPGRAVRARTGSSQSEESGSRERSFARARGITRHEPPA